MRITVLSENTSARADIGAEHGLSLFIEPGDRRILFDMGQGDLFAENAARLGVDLSSADTAILSHGHYDHGGGIGRFLSLNDKAPVYLSRHAFLPHYNGTEKYIGLDRDLEDCDRLVPISQDRDLGDGITVLAGECRTGSYPLSGTELSVMRDGALVPDPFLHEIYLEIKENGRRYLFSGCSHRGALNILHWFTPDVFVGGFHFSKTEPSSLAPFAAEMEKNGTEFYTCHCTGLEQYDFLQKRMSRLSYLRAGDTVII